MTCNPLRCKSHCGQNDATFDESLKVFVDGAKIGKQEIPADWFFVREDGIAKK